MGKIVDKKNTKTQALVCRNKKTKIGIFICWICSYVSWNNNYFKKKIVMKKLIDKVRNIQQNRSDAENSATNINNLGINKTNTFTICADLDLKNYSV